ncbi:hypothetical protein RFI_36469 [Reticulomyxa filosa]|uniref:Uncharacterized protein n=1 Tax=Reticulomyxa filosa TaxID=46433 RepID=X6LI00_RETFI|nr:hypothetical protein RFI_36469 [Reticulomyxa filosa]|eukprot:ETO00971.1 hypothetical protein RFI_36469 [Reticulomyxa filosa]
MQETQSLQHEKNESKESTQNDNSQRQNGIYLRYQLEYIFTQLSRNFEDQLKELWDSLKGQIENLITQQNDSLQINQKEILTHQIGTHY